jgi:hypothetical protein
MEIFVSIDRLLSPLCSKVEQDFYVGEDRTSLSSDAIEPRPAQSASDQPEDADFREKEKPLLIHFRTPRTLLPLITLRSDVLSSSEPLIGLRGGFEQCLHSSRFMTKPLPLEVTPPLWPSLGLSSDDFARILGNQDKWTDSLPSSRGEVLPRKADPFLRFYSLILTSSNQNRSRSKLGTLLSEVMLPPFHPIPIQEDLRLGLRASVFRDQPVHSGSSASQRYSLYLSEHPPFHVASHPAHPIINRLQPQISQVPLPAGRPATPTRQVSLLPRFLVTNQLRIGQSSPKGAQIQNPKISRLPLISTQATGLRPLVVWA